MTQNNNHNQYHFAQGSKFTQGAGALNDLNDLGIDDIRGLEDHRRRSSPAEGNLGDRGAPCTRYDEDQLLGPPEYREGHPDLDDCDDDDDDD